MWYHTPTLMSSSVRARSRVVWAARALAASILTAGEACSTGPPRRPHVVLVVVDALRARNLGCYGYARPTSPVIDRLAREGALFESAFSVGGNTTTAMPAIFTGHYAHVRYGDPWAPAPFGMDRFRRTPGPVGLPDSMTSLAEYLSAAGYRTAGFITNPFLKSTFRMNQGFDHYEEIFNEAGVPYGSAEQVAERALGYLRGLDWKQPTFLYLHLMDTHGPYRKPDPDFLGPGEEAQASFYARFERWEKLRGVEAADHESDLRYMTAAYDTSIRHADRAIGQILQLYEDHGLTDRTLVFLTSDHGDEFLEHGGTTHKGTLFEELIHVPLVARVPGAGRGSRVGALVRNFDVMPTILDYVGLGENTDRMAALSLRALVEGGPPADERTVYASFPHVRMIRTDRFKLLRYADGREALFDLARDPGETRNLNEARYRDEDARRHLVSLRVLLDETVRGLEAQGAGEGPASEGAIDAQTLEQLRALGYVE